MKGLGRRKQEVALALAVSLWIAGGGVAGAYAYIDVMDENIVKVTGGSAGPVEPGIGEQVENKKLTVSGDWGLASFYGVQGSLDDISGYTITVAPNAKIEGVRGAFNKGTGNATNNKVTIGSGAVICSDSVIGGIVSNESANVTNNTVELQGATINGHVLGGKFSINSGATGDIVTGNTLLLSGENTVAGRVRNFQTIKLADTLEWKAGSVVLDPGALCTVTLPMRMTRK